MRSSLVWRSLQTDTSSDFDDDNEAWTPLRRTDYVHLGITIGYQVLVLLVVLHIWLCRTWPPYIPRWVRLNLLFYKYSEIIFYSVFLRKKVHGSGLARPGGLSWTAVWYVIQRDLPQSDPITKP